MLATGIRRLARVSIVVSIVAALAACGSVPVGPGYYRVQRGDTVSQIARNNRQSIQNIVRWNNLSNPNSIDVGQVLRVAPPGGTASAVARRENAPPPPPPPSRGAATPPSAPPPASANVTPASSIALVWPTQGKVVRGFDGQNSKGIDIVNNAGTPIVAAAGGTVVYAGNGLRGYGNLLIIKHNADYLTAYAHNRALFVKEGQQVAQGQKIAEMGDTDNDRVMLHFELRYQGRSIDPMRYLPAR